MREGRIGTEYKGRNGEKREGGRKGEESELTQCRQAFRVRATGGAVLLGDKVAVSPLFQGLGALHREGGEEGAVEGEGEG